MLWIKAPAKVNLSLRVIGRREDSYHEIESLVAFASAGDWLGYRPGPALSLELVGSQELNRSLNNNLVLRAARALANKFPALVLGEFFLVKRVPVAAGLGGGSADAAAALRALAFVNHLRLGDERLHAAAVETGADVPACISSRARFIRGAGDRLGRPVPLPPMFALLVNPGIAVSTRDVFEQLGLSPGQFLEGSEPMIGCSENPITWDMLRWSSNQLEAPARSLKPEIEVVLETLARIPAAKVVRMSGSGATCFALFDASRSVMAAKSLLARQRLDWWIADATVW